MNRNENPLCERAEGVRDYAFDELSLPARKSMEQHLASCPDCAAELDRLRLTTAALRMLPDVEVPRRIAFVSDKVFEQGWLAGIWNSAARFAFPAACVLSLGLSFAAWHRPPEVRTLVQTASVSPAEFDAAVNKAVALAVDKKEKDLILAMSQSMEFMQRQNQMVTRASFSDVPMRVRQ